MHISSLTIGESIRKYRNANRLIQTELAKKLGTTQFVITNYEPGRKNPTAAKLPEIAKPLDVPLEALYGVDKRKPQRVLERSERQRIRNFFANSHLLSNGPYWNMQKD